VASRKPFVHAVKRGLIIYELWFSSGKSGLKELEEVGVELEEMSLGIVDFPAMAGGREVRLCWQLGQETVQFWHEVGATAATRRSVESMPAPVGVGMS